MLKALILSLLRDRGGAAAVFVAGSLFALVGAATVAIDFGSVYLAQRRLQGIADAAAMAAAGDGEVAGRQAVQAIVERSGAAAVTIGSVIPGRYVRDKTVEPGSRFVAEPTSPSAARVVLTQEVPLFFGAVLSGKPTMSITAEATASRKDMAAFSLGTRLAAVSGGLPNQILSALAGTELGLTALDSQNLAAADVDVLSFADALRLRVNQPDATYAELFGMELPLDTVVGAIGDAAPATVSSLLSGVETKLGSETIKLSDLIDLGSVGQSDFSDDGYQIRVDALSLLRSTLELSHGDHYEIELNVAVPGIVSSKLTLVGGQGDVRSPWMTVTDAKDVVIRTAQMRIYLDTNLGDGPLGLLAVRLPVYIELASAEARLTDIVCDGDAEANGVTLEVTPAVGTLAIADVDKTAMRQLAAPLSLQSAKLAYTPLVQINGRAEVALGGVNPQPVHFTRADIDQRRVRSVSTNDLTTGIATSLMKKIQIDTTLLGGSLFGLGSLLGSLITAVANQLTAVTPALDLVLQQLTDALGVRLGVAEVRVENVRCGVPTLVA